MQIYVDMDGVLADFSRHYLRTFGYVPKRPGGTDWKAVRAHKGFYQGIPPMKDLDVLWARLAPYSPIVLTGIPSSVAEAEANKLEWIVKNLFTMPEVICCRAKDKANYCLPGDLLIDDYEKHQHLWLAAGGHWITHISAEATCLRLTLLGII